MPKRKLKDSNASFFSAPGRPLGTSSSVDYLFLIETPLGRLQSTCSCTHSTFEMRADGCDAWSDARVHVYNAVRGRGEETQQLFSPILSILDAGR